jgi:hypothetical protein
MSSCSYRAVRDSDPCIYADECAQYNTVKPVCNFYSGPGTCKLWRIKKAEGER